MGYAILATKSSAQITTLVRIRAKNTESIFWVDHAALRMRQRGIGINEVYEVLRHGSLVRPWWINRKYDTFECRMELYVGGREVGVGVSLDDSDPSILVVTVVTI